MVYDKTKPMDEKMTNLYKNYINCIQELFIGLTTVKNEVLKCLIYNELLKYMADMKSGDKTEILDNYLLILKHDDKFSESNIQNSYNKCENFKIKIEEYTLQLDQE